MNPDDAFAPLPAPLGGWVQGMLDGLPPRERGATCDDCAMCPPPGLPSSPQRIVFHPETRCCTYRPRIPNYAVGALLADPAYPADSPARTSIQQRIAEGDASPLALRVDAAYQLVYWHANGPSFGRARQLRCPHQEADQKCGIWAHRPAICATWHCKHDRGALGGALWGALHGALARAEEVVSLWCLGELGFDGAARRLNLDDLGRDAVDAPALDRQPDPERQQALWGDWLDREEAFYRACAERAATLDWAAIERLAGQELALLADAARELAARHADLALPERLRTGRFEVLGLTAGQLWLKSYSEFDTLEMAPELMDLVARCDGRPTAEILDEHQSRHGRRPPPVFCCAPCWISASCCRRVKKPYTVPQPKAAMIKTT